VLVLQGTFFCIVLPLGWSKNGKLKVFTLASFCLDAHHPNPLGALRLTIMIIVVILVYAHAAPGPKGSWFRCRNFQEDLLVPWILQVAYDQSGLSFGGISPLSKPHQLSGISLSYAGGCTHLLADRKLQAIEPIIRNNYYAFVITFMVAYQDYFNLTLDRLVGILRSPIATGTIQYLHNRVYSLYAEVTNHPSLELANWSPEQR
jgi:hypothetical protein